MPFELYAREIQLKLVQEKKGNVSVHTTGKLRVVRKCSPKEPQEGRGKSFWARKTL